VANTKSAKKRMRQAEARRLRHRMRLGIVKAAIRRFEQALQAGNHEEAFMRLRYASGRLDRAAQKGAMHRNKAARRKSHLWRKYNEATRSHAG
jgi:small subunit ribosomal protein S20